MARVKWFLQCTGQSLLKVYFITSCLEIWLFSSYIAGVSAQDNNITCSVPPVHLHQDTVLTCHFPEDISVTKKDFSVYHYNKGADSDAVLDCWWISANMECVILPGYAYNKTVNTELTVVIRNVTSSHTGIYACQVAGYPTDSFVTCQFNTLQVNSSSETELPSEERPQSGSQIFKPIVIGLSVGLTVTMLIVGLLFLLNRKRRATVNLDAVRKDADQMSLMEGTPMIDRKTNPNQKQMRDEVTQKFQEHLANKTKEMYPNILDAFYFVPPIYFNKIKYAKQSVANQDVYIPALPDRNEVRHDLAMRHVLHCLRHVAERGQEKMFVLTQFEYKDYLNNVSCDYEGHALPVVTSLPQEAEDTGSFDFLIIHRHHGVFAGVVKVLRDDQKKGRDVGTSNVVNEVSSGLKKFKKTCHIVSYLMSDQHERLKIRQLLVLFNIKQSTFQKSLTTQKELLEKLKMCWPICLGRLSDHNIHHGVDSASLTQFEKQWEHVNTQKQDAYRMNYELYLTMIARFCGPATISSLSCETTQPSESFSYQLPKTLDQAVSLTGDMFERFTLYPGMTNLLDKHRICLAGPPGTGKIKLLALVVRKWISEGHDVKIVYSSPDDVVAVKEFRRRLHSINPSQIPIDKEDNVKNIIEILKEKAENRLVFAILDKIDFQKLRGKSFKYFLSKLGKSSNVHVWMAVCTTEHLDTKHSKLHFATVAVSCPQSILRQVQQEDVSFLEHYKDSEYPAPTEGPPVKNIYHVGDGHLLEELPHGCKCCAKNISDFLTQTLCIGADDQNNTAISQERNLHDIEQVSRLRYRDVLFLFECDVDKDTPMVKSLQTSGVQMNIISNTDQNYTIEDDTDIALVAKAGQLLGLKRKVVVYVKGGVDMDDASARWNRVRGITSCTSQLVLVSTPQS